MKDPVCNMEVSEISKASGNYKGKRYYFCSDNCKAKFRKNPKGFVR